MTATQPTTEPDTPDTEPAPTWPVPDWFYERALRTAVYAVGTLPVLEQRLAAETARGDHLAAAYLDAAIDLRRAHTIDELYAAFWGDDA